MAINYLDLGLPSSVMDEVKFSPMEDVSLTILRRAFPDVLILSLIPDDEPTSPLLDEPAEFFILTRRSYQWGKWDGERRGFVDSGGIEVHVYTKDPDGDLKGALISEAVRSVFERAAREKWRIDDHTTVHSIEMMTEPIRKADWATSQGPVQYADMPQGMWRYITTYQVKTRRQTGSA